MTRQEMTKEVRKLRTLLKDFQNRNAALIAENIRLRALVKDQRGDAEVDHHEIGVR